MHNQNAKDDPPYSVIFGWRCFHVIISSGHPQKTGLLQCPTAAVPEEKGKVDFDYAFFSRRKKEPAQAAAAETR